MDSQHSLVDLLLVHSGKVHILLLQVIRRRENPLDVGDVLLGLVVGHLDTLLDSFCLNLPRGVMFVLGHRVGGNSEDNFEVYLAKTRKGEVRQALDLIMNQMVRARSARIRYIMCNENRLEPWGNPKDLSRTLTDEPMSSRLDSFPRLVGRGDFPSRVIPSFLQSSPTENSIRPGGQSPERFHLNP